MTRTAQSSDRPRWRQLATALRRLANSRPGPVPVRVQYDLWTATDDRIAAGRKTPWLR